MTISNLHRELLGLKREKVFDLLSSFSKDFALGGGTAINLFLGKRISYDFDLFSNQPISRTLYKKVTRIFPNYHPLIDNINELTILTKNKIKITFLNFPFLNLYKTKTFQGVKIINLKDLAINKAYAIGRRGNWRDYVDIFFLLQTNIKLENIIKDAQRKFKQAFNEKLFLEQLVYFKDLGNFQINFVDKKYRQEEIKRFLKNLVKNYLKEMLI